MKLSGHEPEALLSWLRVYASWDLERSRRVDKPFAAIPGRVSVQVAEVSKFEAKSSLTFVLIRSYMIHVIGRYVDASLVSR